MQKNFYITWDINVEAETAEEAAQKALAIQRDPNSIATVFEVHDPETRQKQVIDLEEQ